jgi:hypothetical protein
MPELRVYLLENCLINPDPKEGPVAKKAVNPLLGLFVPKLIEMAIGGVATLLKKAGDDETVSATGHDLTDFYVTGDKPVLQTNPLIGCLLAIWGVFKDEDKEKTDPKDEALLLLEKKGYVPKNADIKIIFEAAIRPTADQTAFHLETRHFSVRDFIGERGKNERSYVATVTVTSPGSTADGETIALGNVDLGRVTRGANLILGGHPAGGYPRYLSNLMPWKQISEASKGAYNADLAAGKATNKRYMPVSFNLTLSETADGNKFLVKLGELLDGAKAKAADELSKLILPAERAKAEAERLETAEKLYQDEIKAEIEVRKKVKELKEAVTVEDRAIKEAELKLAKRDLERKTALRAAAGLDPWKPKEVDGRISSKGPKRSSL